MKSTTMIPKLETPTSKASQTPNLVLEEIKGLSDENVAAVTAAMENTLGSYNEFGIRANLARGGVYYILKEDGATRLQMISLSLSASVTFMADGRVFLWDEIKKNPRSKYHRYLKFLQQIGILK